MKKYGLGALAMVGALAIAGCSCNKGDLTGNAKIIDEAKNYSVEKLAELAKGETGKFTVYSTSSKTANALSAFCTKYEISGCEAVQYNDYALYDKLSREIDGNVENGVDVALTQDGLTLKTTMVDTGYLINYNPVVEGAKTSDLYAFMYYVKAIGISDEVTGDDVLTNIWQLTETTNNSFFKSPLEELINMSFLTQLTTDEWAIKLGNAYKTWKNVDDAGLTAALTYTDTKGKTYTYENAGYMFVDKLMKNVNFMSSENDISSAVVDASIPTYGFGAYGKYVKKSNYTTAKTLAGYSYFVYHMYAQISKNTDRPYTSMLFINYISTQEGADFWAKKSIGPGAYSTNTTYVSDQVETLQSVLDNAVVEDVDAILNAPKRVEYFITNSVTSNKKKLK